jgi:hypothetical protein
MIQVEWIREQAQEQFDELLSSAQIPPHQTALLHFSMYNTLHDLADGVEEIFERVTEDSISPSAEQLVHSFYANYLREAAEKERQDLLEAESIKESGSIQVTVLPELLNFFCLYEQSHYQFLEYATRHNERMNYNFAFFS